MTSVVYCLQIETAKKYMEENTNKIIFINTIIMYVRLAVVSVCGLFTTRFALQALGATDFGLFSVIGGVITFLSLLNTIMLSTSNRFIATAIGKKDDKLANETFNVNLTIHFLIACITLIIAYPLGDWYIAHHVNFNGDINLAIKVFNITIIGSVISFIGVPYNGLMMAKERFLAFSIVDIVSHLLKLFGALSLLYCFDNKLLAYTWIITVLSIFPTLFFILYCKKEFSELSAIKIVHNSLIYKEVMTYSIWIGYGAIATIGKSQGAALVINKFFDTVMNTALGVANSVNLIIQQIAFNIGKSITPQITKSYAAGNIDRAESLAIVCSKYTFLMLLLTASPFLVEPEFLLHLWLGEIPQYATLFTRLLIMDALIISLNAGIPELIFASGKIKWYQLIVNTLLIFSVIAAFFILLSGKPAYYLQITYIAFSIIILVVRQIVLNVVVKFNNWRLIRESYLPCFAVGLLFLLYFSFNYKLSPIWNIVLAFIYIFFLEVLIGLRQTDRKHIFSLISNHIHKQTHLYNAPKR